MTYESLFIYLDELQTHLPKCANAVLLKLIARCIESGETRISISTRDLAQGLKISRDAVRTAAIALQGIVAVEKDPDEQNSPWTWILPGDWFSPQRPLFINREFPTDPGISTGGLETRPPRPVEIRPVCRPRWSTYQATRGLVSRPPETQNQQFPVGGGLVTRPPWPGNSTTLAWFPGHPGLVSRPPQTQNQQHTDGGGLVTRPPATIDRSIDQSAISSSLFDRSALADQIVRIVAATSIPAHLVEQGSMLSEHLRAYAQEFGPAKLASSTPTETILARCLAIAPLGDLTSQLRQMHSEAVRAGKKYAWFVTVLANRIHKIPPEELAEAQTRYFSRRKKPIRENANPEFGQQLLEKAAAGKNLR